MKIEIEHPGLVHGIGKRTNNEDRFFPGEAAQSSENRLFMVCDGVGGSERGEIASQIVCTAVPSYFELNRITVSTSQIIHDAIGFAQSEINAFVTEHPGANRMATTFTLLHLHEKGATVAHIGDSRVYHIRSGRIIWKTVDHSYVNDLVKAGVINEHEARSHPRRNVITRAIQAGDTAVAADVDLIENLEAGDYFFLCSDGILEAISEEKLCEILSSNHPETEKIAFINELCIAASSDNFTGYLIRMRSVETLNMELLDSTAGNDTNQENRIQKQKKQTWFSKNGLWLLAVLIAVAGGFLFAKNQLKPLPKPKVKQMAVSYAPDSLPAAKTQVTMEKRKKIRKKHSKTR